MSQHSCPVVKIQSEVSEENPSGYIVINEEDFDEEIHKLFNKEGEVEQVKPLTKAEKAAAKAEAKQPWAQ
jgi:c-di-AMP phosphodiesterase-like protein